MMKRSPTLCDQLHEIGERDTQVQLLRGDARSGADLQGPQVAPHPRRPGLHSALDPLRRDPAGANRGHRPEPARRPGGDPAGDEAEPRVLQDGLRRPAQRQEDAEERRRRRSRPSTTTWPNVLSTLFRPVIDHLREVGEVRSCSEIEDHFQRNFDVSGVTAACEYLADQGLIGKASTPVQLTRKSNIEVQELAFFYLEERPDGV